MQLTNRTAPRSVAFGHAWGLRVLATQLAISANVPQDRSDSDDSAEVIQTRSRARVNRSDEAR